MISRLVQKISDRNELFREATGRNVKITEVGVKKIMRFFSASDSVFSQ